MSLNHKDCVCGWKPPKNVKIAVPAPSLVLNACVALSGFSAYTVQFPVKNGVNHAGCGGVVKKLSQPT